MLTRKKHTKTVGRIPVEFDTKALRTARALTGEELGVVVDEEAKQATVSFACDSPLDVGAAQDVCRAIGQLAHVFCVVATMGPGGVADTIAVTLADDSSTRKTDVEDVIGEVELIVPQVSDIIADAGFVMTPLRVGDVIAHVEAALPGATAGDFPPVVAHAATSLRYSSIEHHAVAAFEVLVDESLAVDAIIDVVDALECQSVVHLVYRPGVGGIAGGRFAASWCIYADSAHDLEVIASEVISHVGPLTRLRIRRSLHRHITMAALGACSGVLPWDYLEFKGGL